MIKYRVSDGICLLQLDRPPLNLIDFELLAELRKAVRRAQEDREAGAMVITGSQGVFSAGADVHLFEGISERESAVRISRIFQDVLGEVEGSAKPVLAAMAGQVIGAALELAAACHYRLAAEGCRFRMPEVQLGINPGAGATQRLPRLIGVEAALQMLLTGEPIDAEQALAWGLVDAICGADQLLERAKRFLHAHPTPRRTSLRTDKLGDAAGWREVLRQAEQRAAAGRAELIAPVRIVGAIRRGLEESVTAGMAEEQQAFADCMETPATQNKIYLFFASRQTADLPELEDVAPRPVETVGVIGMGTMGTGIVQALALADLPVRVLDQDAAAVRRGMERVRVGLARRVERGQLAPEEMERRLERICPTRSWDQFAETQLVIESVYEDLATKRRVLADLESVCPPSVVIATNTSTITLEELGAEMEHPGRLVGLHFFNPAQRMPLVEVGRRADTPADVLATAVHMARRLGKTPVVVRSRPGFVVTRLFVPYVVEAFWLLEEGIAPRAIDAAMVEFGLPMGPLQLIDMTGLDILVCSHRVLSRAFPWHGPLPEVVQRLHDAGHLGQKTGQGVYWYEPGERTPRENPVTSEILAQLGRRPAGEPPAAEISERLVLRMVVEALRVLDEGVARCRADVDVASVLGLGFPDFRGGVVGYAEKRGLQEVRARLEELAARHGPRFEPCFSTREAEGGNG